MALACLEAHEANEEGDQRRAGDVSRAGSHSCHEESGFCSQCGLSSQEVSRRGLGSYCLDLDMARAFVGLSVSLSASHQKRKT